VLPQDGAVYLLHVASFGSGANKSEFEARLRALAPAAAAARGALTEVRPMWVVRPRHAA